MPEITINLTDQQLADIAMSKYGVPGAVSDLVKAEATKAIEATLKGSLVTSLLESLKDLVPKDKIEATLYVSVLKEAHTLVQDKLAEIGLDYEIYVTLADGRYLDRYDDYGKTWISSSDNC